MKSSLRFTFLLFAFCQWFTLQAQQDIAIGDWNAYLPFNQSWQVAQSDNYIYSAAERGLLRIRKSDLLIEKITKVDGLSDTEPRNIVFEPGTQSLVIAYDNGNIDIMTSEGIINMPNILSNENIVTSKSPNHIRIDSRSKAYVAYDFGLVQLNPELLVFGFTLRTTFEIYDFVEFGDRFYFSSADGIYWADANPNLNHADLSVWTRFDNGWPMDYTSLSIGALNGHLFCDVNGDLMEIVNGQPILIKEAKQDYFIRNISTLDDHIAVSYQYDRDVGGFKIDELFFINENGEEIAAYTSSNCVIVVHDVLQDEQGRIWYANESSLKYLEEIGVGCAQINTTGPPNSDAFEVTFHDQEVIVATGEVGDNNTPRFNNSGVFHYLDSEWNQFSHRNGFFGDSVFDYTDVDVSINGQLAIGTFRQGVILVPPDWSSAQLINDHNSCLEAQELVNISTASDVKFDARGDLWISNFRANTPLKMIDRDGNCHTFPSTRNFVSGDIMEMAIDDRGYKWIATTDPQVALYVFDEGDIEDTGDDRFRVINAANSEITDNIVRDVETDLDGDVWVGTDQGAIVFECAGAIFDNGCSGRRPIVEVDGVAALLLENERVRAIAVDGANRKWFGTTNGIFVQSPNGEEEILRFDERNSPLISNFIRDININPLTGEVFISTDKGLMSYRTDATDGGSVHQAESEVYAFPNPVRPGYEGPIAIKGLPRDARVKITDVKGQLIYEGEANGGEAIWDGRDYNGRRAASGVYLVFSTSQSAFDKPDALVSKILIVN